MSHNETAVAVFAMMFIFGGPVAAFIAWRYFAHRERMAMIRQGMPLQAGRDFYPHPEMASPGPANGGFYSAQKALRRGMTLTFAGFALLVGLSFIGLHEGPEGSWIPGPWLLGGLIPFFIGLAQIVTALLSGATLQAPGSSAKPPPSTVYGVPPQSGHPGSGTGPYTYRPPGDQSELTGGPFPKA